MSAQVDVERFLVEQAHRFRNDPLGFIYFAFDDIQPHDWQRDSLEDIRLALEQGKSRQEAIQIATASGHGVGKSCFVAWLILWAIATESDCKGVVTANTETQLKTKTWAELAKWYALFRYKHWFELTATALFSSVEGHDKIWRIDMVPWSERNTEAFAGLHNAGRRVLLIFDEASAIPDKIWEVSEGALSDEDTQIIWAAFGNPTRNTGRFRECFGRFKHRWKTRQIDSREVPGTSKSTIQKWVDDYGEESDFVKVRVRGIFPSAGSNQFIDSDCVADCVAMKAEGYEHMPKILACDVARFGDDQTVMGIRQGRKVFAPKKYRGLDTMQVASFMAEMADTHKPDAIIIDETGLGAGVVDRLRQLRYKVFGFNGGGKPDDPATYFNRRAEVWGLMREALRAGLDIPPDRELQDEISSVEYSFTPKQQIILEKKEDMKSRGLSSPDVADWLAMSFAVAPAARDKPKKNHHSVSRGGWM